MTDKILYTIWCEWDISQRGKIFKTIDEAKQWVELNWNEPELGDMQEAYDHGLIIIEELETIHQQTMVEEPMEVKLINIYCITTFDEEGIQYLNSYLTMEEAMNECDCDQTPFLIETFEGSNIHLEALKYND